MNKKLLATLAALTALPALSSCAMLPLALSAVSALQPASAAGDKVVLEGTRALILAHNAFQGAAAAAAPLIRSGAMSREQVDLAEDITNRAEMLFATAGGGLSEAQRAAAILNLADQMNKLAGK